MVLYGIRSSFEAAHTPPLVNKDLWGRWNYGWWITDMDDNVGSKVNSCQNGYAPGIRSVHNISQSGFECMDMEAIGSYIGSSGMVSRSWYFVRIT